MAAPTKLPETFTFEVDGEQYELPAFNKLKAGLVRKIRSMSEADALFAVLEAVCDERTMAAVDGMDMAQLRDVVQGWQKAAGVSLGESSSSSG